MPAWFYAVQHYFISNIQYLHSNIQYIFFCDVSWVPCMHITIKLLQPINARRKLHDIYTCIHNGYIKNVHT